MDKDFYKPPISQSQAKNNIYYVYFAILKSR